jgi:type II secretory pathway component PulF
VRQRHLQAKPHLGSACAPVNAPVPIIEPLMMIGVGLMVGVIIISMYLPMFKMLSLIK